MNYASPLEAHLPAGDAMILVSRDQMEAHAAKLSLIARPGMIILLEGELGTGKTTYARAFIKALAPPNIDFDIPSPTFTLIQTYDETRLPVAHADLYRVGSPEEVHELGFDELIHSHVLLVEWPDRLPHLPSADMLRIQFEGSGNSRQLTIESEGKWIEALARSGEIDDFIENTRWRGAERRFLEGDASFRRYEILEHAGACALLMDMPARPDGPPIRNGLAYSQVAHLAEGIGAVIAINGELVRRGYSAPVVHEADRARGLAIIEDLGRMGFGCLHRRGEDMRLPMAAAADVLADIASRSWPEEIHSPGYVHKIHRYDQEAQLIEVDLLPSWFWPYRYDMAVPRALRDKFTGLWSELLPLTRSSAPVWTLRDYHSPNLLWLPERAGLKRVGLIDTQDAVMGHPAYDLVSLLQDARVDIDPQLAENLFEHYCHRRSGSGFDRAEFSAAYAILGAQRATKILGIFARLSKRDGKQGYLQHVPRVSRYLETNLRHPVLKHLRKWFDLHLPAAIRESRS